MCGIAGFVCTPGRTFAEAVMRDALDALKRRGPEGTSWLGVTQDGAMHWTREAECVPGRRLKLAFGCSRLAINDTSLAGLQPIASADLTCWVAFNGEIFNFVELRMELSALGYGFRTATDTEVIANAYLAWGEDCFSRLNGQFAIAVFDQAQGRLVLARDRVGITPLFYRESEAGLMFGSEIKAVLQAPLPVPQPDIGQIAVRIGLPYKLHHRPGRTLYEDVFAVRPGEYIAFELPGLRCRHTQYWSLNDFQRQKTGSFAEAKEQLRELLIDAVRIRLRTDRQFAFIVSGGVDSPAVFGIARKIFGVETRTFSLDLPDERFNENDSIAEVLAWHGLSQNFIPVTPQRVADLVAEVVDYADEPLATPNAVLHGIMARAIDATGTRVVLNGVGGDEVFLGYHDHFLFHLRQLRENGDPSFDREISAWQRLQGRPRELFEDFCRFVDSGAARHSPDFLARSQGFDYRVLLDGDLCANRLDEAALFDASDHSPSGKQAIDIASLTIPHAVRMDDNCYLSQAVEVRQPFLDHRLIEFGLSLPAHYKIRRGVSKFILRQSVRGLIPDTRRRDVRKVGLNLPIDTWMRGSLRGWVEDSLVNRNGPLYDYADYGAVQDVLCRHFDGSANHSLKIWDLCCMNDWLGRLQQTPATRNYY